MGISLEACRAETIRLADAVAAPTFGVKAPIESGVYTAFRTRQELQTSVKDGAVSELDLLRSGTLMAQFIRGAESANARAKHTEADIRREVAATLLSINPKPPTEAEILDEMAKVPAELVAHHVSERAKAAEVCTQEAGVVAALHGAIQAQLAAQPGWISAIEYVKDNAERFGVTGAIADARSTLRSVEVTPQVKDAIQTVVRKAEGILGRLFGSR